MLTGQYVILQKTSSYERQDNGQGESGEADEESYKCSSTLFSEQPEAMQGFKQTWQQKGVLSDLQVRKITLDAGWNEMARGNMEALRLCKSSPKQSRIERIYPELGGVGEIKSSRNIQETFTGYDHGSFLIDGRICSEKDEREVKDDTQVFDLHNNVGSGHLIKKN